MPDIVNGTLAAPYLSLTVTNVGTAAVVASVTIGVGQGVQLVGPSLQSVQPGKQLFSVPHPHQAGKSQ